MTKAEKVLRCGHVWEGDNGELEVDTVRQEKLQQKESRINHKQGQSRWTGRTPAGCRCMPPSPVACLHGSSSRGRLARGSGVTVPVASSWLGFDSCSPTLCLFICLSDWSFFKQRKNMRSSKMLLREAAWKMMIMASKVIKVVSLLKI
jgi:hypothetical protein